LSTGEHQLQFPEGFDDHAWEVEAKGWFQGAIAIINQRRYPVTFYDPVRLAQDIAEELRAGAVFFERNLLVVPAVTRTHMEAAVGVIARTGRYLEMISEREPHIP
jgi:hypothetical protein